MSWRDDALCKNADPNYFDLDWIANKWGIRDWWAQDEYAKDLCAGCPVMGECARDALVPLDVADFALTPDASVGLCFTEGVVRAGLAVRSVVSANRARGFAALARVGGVDRVGSYVRRRAGWCVVCGGRFGVVRRRSARLCVGCVGRGVA